MDFIGQHPRITRVVISTLLGFIVGFMLLPALGFTSAGKSNNITYFKPLQLSIIITFFSSSNIQESLLGHWRQYFNLGLVMSLPDHFLLFFKASPQLEWDYIILEQWGAS